ncbi:cell growth regulator with EF hand domain protein 1 [Pterocles gutturalis]
MRTPPVAPVLLLLLLVPADRAAPKAGGHRPEDPMAMLPDPDLDPLSPEPPVLPLLRSTVRSLGLLVQDAEAMTREQALLYLFVWHDHDRSGRLDGLELLQLLGAVLVQQDGGRPHPEAVAVLVDRVLERQDLSGDGLLDAPELLLSPSWGQGPLGQPLLQPPRQPPAGAVPGGDTEEPAGDMDTGEPGGDTGVSSPAEGQGLPGGGAPPEGQAAPQDEAPHSEATEAEERPENEGPEDGGEAALGWGDPGEG